jgi:hypothetical protein
MSTRTDHVIVSPSLLPFVESISVDLQRLDSDHFPLCTIICLPLAQRAPSLLDGIPLHPIKWRPSCQSQYAKAIQEDCEHIKNSCKEAIEAGDLKASIQLLYHMVEVAAIHADMPRK